MHTHAYAYGEVMMPTSAVNQLKDLIPEGKVRLVNDSGLDSKVRATYDAAYNNLAKVMVDPTRPNKNIGKRWRNSVAKKNCEGTLACCRKKERNF